MDGNVDGPLGEVKAMSAVRSAERFSYFVPKPLWRVSCELRAFHMDVTQIAVSNAPDFAKAC